MLKAGSYMATLRGYHFAENSNGKPYVQIVADCDGHQVRTNFYLTEKALEYTVKKLKEYGGCEHILERNPPVPAAEGDLLNMNGLVGTTAPVIVKYNEGSEYPNFDFPGVGDGTKKQVNPDNVNAINQALEALMGSKDSDIPF